MTNKEMDEERKTLKALTKTHNDSFAEVFFEGVIIGFLMVFSLVILKGLFFLCALLIIYPESLMIVCAMIIIGLVLRIVSGGGND
jgi:hypothetical protein